MQFLECPGQRSGEASSWSLLWKWAVLAALPCSVTSWGQSQHKDEARSRRAATRTISQLGSSQQETEDCTLLATPSHPELACQASHSSFSSTVFPVQHQHSWLVESALPVTFIVWCSALHMGLEWSWARPPASESPRGRGADHWAQARHTEWDSLGLGPRLCSSSRLRRWLYARQSH